MTPTRQQIQETIAFAFDAAESFRRYKDYGESSHERLWREAREARAALDTLVSAIPGEKVWTESEIVAEINKCGVVREVEAFDGPFYLPGHTRVEIRLDALLRVFRAFGVNVEGE